MELVHDHLLQNVLVQCCQLVLLVQARVGFHRAGIHLQDPRVYQHLTARVPLLLSLLIYRRLTARLIHLRVHLVYRRLTARLHPLQDPRVYRRLTAQVYHLQNPRQ